MRITNGHKFVGSVLLLTVLLWCAVSLGQQLGSSKIRAGYILGAYETTRYGQLTGHQPSWAWIVTAASYQRPDGQSDDDWIRITEAKATAWEAEHVKSASTVTQ